MKALPKILLALTGVAALSLAYPASVQADTTYTYTGNPFTSVSGPPYTMSDFVSGMLTLAGPLAPNFSGNVTPIAFSFSDGVQTLTKQTPGTITLFSFQTGPTGAITGWLVAINLAVGGSIQTETAPPALVTLDFGADIGSAFGRVSGDPGTWAMVTGVPDTGSTLTLMTVTLMALGLVARQSSGQRDRARAGRGRLLAFRH